MKFIDTVRRGTRAHTVRALVMKYPTARLFSDVPVEHMYTHTVSYALDCGSQTIS